VAQEISRLKKEGKINKKLFYQLYPSDAVPPRLYGFVKAHKPTKNYPMRPVVSTIGTPFHSTSEFLVQLLQPMLNKNQIRVKNSTSFVEEAQTWEISPGEVQCSYDVVNLYPSVPIKKAIESMMEMIHDDWDDISTQTNLSEADIRNLLELCLQKCYFLWENDIYVIDDAGPIGLSLMVIVAESYLQFLEAQALDDAELLDCCPKTFRRYVDDSHARFANDDQSNRFMEVLNCQDEKIQYTVEKEEAGKLPFLDILIINDGDSSYKFKVHRKDAITNLQLKPNSSINPSLIMGVFKGFLSRAKRICSEEFINDEINFLVEMFVENGYQRSMLRNIVTNYGVNSTIERDPTKPVVRIPWIPVIGPKLRKTLKKYGCSVIFSSGRNLKDMLCNHKTPLPKNSGSGVYKLECECSSVYVGETKKQIRTRIKEHEHDVFKGKWKASGATEHAERCQQAFKWEDVTTIANEPDYRRRKVREAIEIRRARRSDRLCVNKDNGNIMKTSHWDHLLGKLRN